MTVTATPSHRVLLVGCGSPAQDRLRDVYLGALQDRPDSAVSVWDDAVEERVPDGAEGLGLVPDLADAVARHTAVVACIGASTPQLLRAAETRATPILLDTPTSLATSDLARLALRAGSNVRAAHHWRFHPAVAAVRGAVNSGRLGLVHALHGELLVGDETASPGGDLRGLVLHAIDVVTSILGPLSGQAYAVRAPAHEGAGDAWTVSLRLHPDVAVTLVVGRSGTRAATVHRYRVLGSHGQLLADLAGPAVDVIGADPRAVPFGPSPVDLLLDSFLDRGGADIPDLSSTLATARVLDALDASSTTNTVHTLGDNA